MATKIKFDEEEIDINTLTEDAKNTLSLIQFTDQKIEEIKNMQALLVRAKRSYLHSLKQEMVSKKAGLILEDN